MSSIYQTLISQCLAQRKYSINFSTITAIISRPWGEIKKKKTSTGPKVN